MMSRYIFFLLLFRICTGITNQPRIETDNGHLKFSTGSGKNIEFSTDSGKILIDALDLKAQLERYDRYS